MTLKEKIFFKFQKEKRRKFLWELCIWTCWFKRTASWDIDFDVFLFFFFFVLSRRAPILFYIAFPSLWSFLFTGRVYSDFFSLSLGRFFIRSPHFCILIYIWSCCCSVSLRQQLPHAVLFSPSTRLHPWFPLSFHPQPNDDKTHSLRHQCNKKKRKDKTTTDGHM